MINTELHELLSPYIEAPVECDGFTRLAHTALANASIEHTCMIGRLTSVGGERQTPIHYWIELPDGQVIDYRAKMWLGDDESVPYGVFHPARYKMWCYQGKPIDLPVLHPMIVKVLMFSLPLSSLSRAV